MATAAEVAAAEQAAKETAAMFNAQNNPGVTDEEAAARAAAAEAAAMTGNIAADGTTTSRPDTPEEIAASEAAAAEKAAKDKADVDAKAAEAEKTLEEQEAAEDDKSDAAAEETTEWVTTDSKEFNAAIGLMKAADMTPGEAGTIFNEAIKTGDLSKVDQAALVAKVGEDKAALIMAGFTTFTEKEGRAALERSQAVQAEVGGADNWATMQDWARAKAKDDPAFKEDILEITKLLNGESAYAAKMAAKSFAEMYNSDAGNAKLGSKAAVAEPAGAAVPAAKSTTPLSARQYAEKMADVQRIVNAGEREKAVAALRRDRAAGRAAGL